MMKTHDYVHYFRGYWSEGGKCRMRIYQEEGQTTVIISPSVRMATTQAYLLFGMPGNVSYTPPVQLR
jgi:hypothetical protein